MSWCPPPTETRALCQRAVKFYGRDTWPLQAWRCSQHSDIILFFKQRTEKHRIWDFLEGAFPRLAPCKVAKIMRWTHLSFSSLFWPLATGMAFEDIPYGALIWLWPGSHGHFRWGMWPRCPKSQLSLKIRKSGLWALWSQPRGHTAQGGVANGLLFSICLLPTSYSLAQANSWCAAFP